MNFDGLHKHVYPVESPLWDAFEMSRLSEDEKSKNY